jgi:AI-2 transport system ATP-binding protein
MSLDKKEPFVSMRSIWKFFSGVAVLKGVNIDLWSGEVHTLLGGNGSGKSTLMKILSGAYQRDSGTLLLSGQEINFSNPQAAHEHGIYLVPQEPKIFPNMTVLENIITGLKVKNKDIASRVAAYAKDLGFDGSISDYASTLSIANQQLLEIIRGLIRDAQVLILDEPTSTLTFKEVASLFERIKILTERGIGIFFISHRLNEVFEISNRISVLQDGAIVFTKDVTECTPKDIIRAMLPGNEEASDSIDGREELKKKNVNDNLEEVFRVEHLTGYGFSDISFNVMKGEVLGFAGVVGAGRTELAHAIIGLDPFAKGRVYLKGKELKNRSPRSCLSQGLGYLPEDRHLHGIFLDLPNSQTISAGILYRLSRPFISRRKEEELVSNYIKELHIKVSSSSQISRTLSGGNQQKVVLAKILATNPHLVILDEPTRGVDAKARQDVYKIINELKIRGISIILISSDLPEVIQESDRILVMHNGRIDKEFRSDSFDLEKITASAFGLGVAP